MVSAKRKRVMAQLDDETALQLAALCATTRLDESKVIRRAIATMFYAWHAVQGSDPRHFGKWAAAREDGDRDGA